MTGRVLLAAFAAVAVFVLGGVAADIGNLDVINSGQAERLRQLQTEVDELSARVDALEERLDSNGDSDSSPATPDLQGLLELFCALQPDVALCRPES